MEASVVALLVVGAIFGAAVLALALKSDRPDRRVTEAAERLSRAQEGRIFRAFRSRFTSVSFRLQGLQARVEWIRRECTRLVVLLRAAAPGVLHICPESAARRLAARLSSVSPVDLEVGHSSFDRMYDVRCSPASFLASLFSVERRGDVVACIRRLADIALMKVDLSRDVLRLEWEDVVTNSADLQLLVQSGGQFLRWLEELRPVVEIVWVSPVSLKAERSLGQCQVCCAEMRAPVKLCPSCATPHHIECWDYNSGCSTFACGARGAAPRREANREPRDRRSALRESNREFYDRYRETWRL